MSKITAYSQLTTVSPADLLIGVDVSDTSMAATGTDKKITVADLLAADGVFSAVNPAYAAGDFGAQVNNAIAAADAAGGGIVAIPPGAYSYSTGIVNTGRYVSILGAGRWATQLNYTGSGDAMRVYNPYYGGNSRWAPSIRDLTIDGAGAGAGAAGLHIGDADQYELNIAVQNFSGAGSIGVHLDNTIWWTERVHGTIFARNCTSHVVFDVTNPYAYASTTLVSAAGGVATFTNAGGWNVPGTTVPLQAGMLLLGSAGLTTPTSSNVSTLSVTSVSGTTLTCAYTGTAPSGTSGTLTLVSSTNSFGYLDLTCQLYVQPNQDGVVAQNGAFIYHGSLAVKGGFQGSASAVTNAALRITGTMPTGHQNAGLGSSIGRSRLDIQAETPSAANSPSTIIFGAAVTNNIYGCYGIMDFTQGTGSFVASNLVMANNATTFTFEGPLIGDSNLGGTFGSGGGMATVGTKIYGASFMSGSNGNVFAQWGDFFSATLSANITISLTPSSNPTHVSPQRKTIIIKQAAAGGPFTVTWPHTASPAQTSPTVNWPGGTAPTMTATANAVDVYKLETLDGKTWYGQALQNVS